MSFNTKRSFNQVFNSQTNGSDNSTKKSNGLLATSQNFFVEDSRDVAVAKMFIVLRQKNVSTTEKPEEAHSSPISDTDKKVSKRMVVADKSTSVISASHSKNEKPMAMKAYRKSKCSKTLTKNIDISAQDQPRKKTQVGSFVFSVSSSNASFVKIRKGYQPTKAVSALPNDRAHVKKLNKENVCSTKKREKAYSSSNCDANKQTKLSKQMVATVKSASVLSGHLELTMKKFIGWSFLLYNDYRHIFVSNSYNIGGYRFHIEINSNPMAGFPGKSNEYFASFHRRFGILLVCDYAFPDPALRLASNFVITLKAKNSKFQDHRINCSTVFSAYNKSRGTLVASSFVANANNGLLHRKDTLCIAIDVEFITPKKLVQKPQPLASIIV